MMILGLDPGLAALGWGMVALLGDTPGWIGHGVIKTSKQRGLAKGRDLELRVSGLARQLGVILDTYQPIAAAMEEFRFYGRALPSTLQLANVTGMLRELLRTRGVGVVSYSARELKMAVTGSATAPKWQVQRMVKRLLHLESIPKPQHAADALAVAITLARHAAKSPLTMTQSHGNFTP